MLTDLRLGDCLDVMRTLPADSVDAVVTDPPAGIRFMGKAWDADRGGRDRFVEWLAGRMAEAFRLAKPGSYALVWALPKTSHWTAWALENAGWVVDDRISHVFGQGMPKAKSKLKPAVEDWHLVRKPGNRATPLNIDACRVETGDDTTRNNNGTALGRMNDDGWQARAILTGGHSLGRWPANLIHDGSDEVLALFPHTKSGKATPENGKRRDGHHDYRFAPGNVVYGDEGSAARFFWCSKATTADADRDLGNSHPTVKSTRLMRYLCRLIADPGDTVLDCFMGSGSTGKACALEGFDFLGITQDRVDLTTARKRIDRVRQHSPLLAGSVA